MAATLEVNDLTTGYGEVQILWGVSLRLDPGKLTALVGSNGAGKTTLLRAVTGLLPAWGGAVVFGGHDVTRLPAHVRAGEGLVLVPEGRQLFSDMTVHENLELGAFSRRAQPATRRNLERVFEMFPRLRDRRGQKAGTLSGGEQQMVAVARGLMADPKVLMLDELSLGLAPRLVLDLFASLRRLKAEGLTMLLVEQNVAMAMAVSDHAYVLAEGRVHLEGPASELARREEVRRAYLGM
ncbi:ABC transporter ATP-binding protein [Sorangium sp. So ce513]|uniref:ABC transporter ATP-binding protein n=1 Tax=Sorangium sp. So ce513 TaxID=3133315 RepID=UPI003F645582